MVGIWGDIPEEKNTTLVFTLDLGKKQHGGICLAAASAFQVFADGELIAYGPNRAAASFARVSEYSFFARTLSVLVCSYGIKTFCMMKQAPFFRAAVKTEDGSEFTHGDFLCRKITDRVQRVQRFGYQRSFSEVYRMQRDRGDFSHFPVLEVKPAGDVRLLESETENPRFVFHAPEKIREGSVSYDDSLPVWRDRGQENVGKELDGYLIEEWDESATDEVSHMMLDGEGTDRYELYDFGRALTGFLGCRVNAGTPATVYFVFDEVLTEKKFKKDVCFYRGTCSNVIKWTLENAGEYSLIAFEPYTARYLKVIVRGEAEIRPFLRDFENPSAQAFGFSVGDGDAEKILNAARSTFAQNAVDILTDCPSRERAGWLSDSWFTSVSERLFTGDNKAERAFLENYALFNACSLPKGMLPMCYPADDYDGMYIPNWAMWYVHEIVKYAMLYGKDKTVQTAYPKIEGIVNYFADKTNEFGLLEDLESWVFVEWSAANASERTKGVNIPSNICWAAALLGAGELYNRKDWIQAGERARSAVKRFGFDGEMFVDNLIRKNGEPARTSYYSEVCQYYLFWFGIATKEEYPALYEELIERLGPKRREGYRREVAKPNAMYGIYMRLDLIMRDGRRSQLYDECKGYFLKMAETTGTLWENDYIYGSLVHGFASYAAKWFVYALTGYDAQTETVRSQEGIGVKCRFEIPRKNGRLILER